MYNRILVPLDGSSLAESVLPHVVAVAISSETKVTLLRVLDPIGAATRPLSVDPVEWQIRKAEADDYLRNLANKIQEAGIQATAETMEGKAAESVIDYAHESNAELIMMSSHGQSGISGWNVSSVVQKIILRVKTSFFITRAYKPVHEDMESLHYKRILVPLDGSQRAEFVLPGITALAKAHNSHVIIGHVVKQPEMPRRTPIAHDDMELINKINERNRAEASKYLNELKTRLDLDIESRLMVSDSVASTLHTLVDQTDADLVVLSAHGYTGETRWPYGSVVISFIAYGTTPLLVLQDVPADQIAPTPAELASKERGGR
jgi:nucleotide-binding universal stress UspA family protein